MTCPVCCKDFNRSSRKVVECGFCNYQACTNCYRRFLLESTDDPDCMSCKHTWDGEFLDKTFTKSFMNNEYKKHRAEVLFDREKSLLPATQPYAEVYAQMMKSKDRIRELMTAISVAKKNLALRRLDMHVYTPDTIIMLRDAEKLVQMNVIDLKYERDITTFLRNQLYRNEPITEEKRSFVRACPATDCRGFLSTAWKCGMCSVWVCPDCHEIKGDHRDAPHACKPENVETAKMIAKDSRPCPSCAALIFKIDGCDQMYCTMCHTAFSWRTGQVETGRIHNPHYYEYMRRNGGNLPRAPGDVPCGGIPELPVLERCLREVIPIRMLHSIYRLHTHIDYVVLPMYTVHPFDDNRDLRIKFLLRELTEERFKQLLKTREKARDKKRAFRMIIDMFQNTLTDLLRRMVAATTKEQTQQAWEELLELRAYANEQFIAVSNRFSCVHPYIAERGMMGAIEEEEGWEFFGA